MDWQTLAEILVSAHGCWGPALSPDDDQVAYISDRDGRPQLWVQAVDDPDTARMLPLSTDPVTAVRWSADGAWLACAVATAGGVRSELWLTRPDGSSARRVAGGEPSTGGDGHHVTLGPWSRLGATLAFRVAPSGPHEDSHCFLLDAHDPGARFEPLASGALVDVVDLSGDQQFALLRDGTRGAEFCVLLDRRADSDHAALPYPGTGATVGGLLRPGPDGGLVTYLISDAGQPRPLLVAASLGEHGERLSVGALAQRDDAELELLAGDDAGRVLVLGWNVRGRSAVEVLDCVTGRRRLVDLPGAVVSGCAVSRQGSCALLSVQSPDSPRRLWRLDLATLALAPVTAASLPDGLPLVTPELVEFDGEDGLPLSGWLYRRPDAADPGPLMLSLHGGPEGQERPDFEPQHQVKAAAGIAVFAPNVRGSSGFGRHFLHADDRYGRFEAIDDVRRCVEVMVEDAVAAPGRVAVTGRSYGGYLALMALVHFPELFAAGVDICGMSDLLTFYRDTEPWIAAAAVTKYGDPESDRHLLGELSPLRYADRITAALLVVHGELDTNVPIGEAHQIVAALRALHRPVDYLELTGEGHEYRRRSSRRRLLEAMTGFLLDRL